MGNSSVDLFCGRTAGRTLLAACLGVLFACSAWAAAPEPVLSELDKLTSFATERSENGGYLSELPDGASFGIEKTIAFEENNHFVYLGGKYRAIIYVKPSIYIYVDYTNIGVTENSNFPIKHCGTIADGGLQEQTVKKADDQVVLSVEDSSRSIRLTLPKAPGAVNTATITITDAEGKKLVDERLLPSGILPLGEGGARLLAGWDRAYQNERRAAWDTRRPSSNLVAAVESEAVKKGRAVVLGCGTGTNAIYLAKQGFKVTGVDIAPTALKIAKEKADKAGVKVDWALADVTRVPAMEPFDLVFDRGCYHGVRRGNAAGYVATLRQVTKPGSQALILAGNANEARHYGPPRVKEEEIRGDFSKDFDFTWLKESHFDSFDESQTGPLSWSILLKRK